ncbi:hypothetical protein PMZ80_000232 [Knufia obscura]|uniref:Uncharacterized protein n=2 Tax=Knufia TaxID=430999 RepID=A0AAN8EJF4_9EURO|nr:hypothetical protein PMZ80_000232 [Knufia obscura]KAK5956838.1 hypothetical protein OHC33_002327 [Knufia fluminis]
MSSLPSKPAPTANCSLAQGQHGSAEESNFHPPARNYVSPPPNFPTSDDSASNIEDKSDSHSNSAIPPQSSRGGHSSSEADRSARVGSENIESSEGDISASSMPYGDLLTLSGYASAKPWINAVLAAIHGSQVTQPQRTPEEDRAAINTYLNHLLDEYKLPNAGGDVFLHEYLSFHNPKVDESVIAQTLSTLAARDTMTDTSSTGGTQADAAMRLADLSISSDTGANSRTTDSNTVVVRHLISGLLVDIREFHDCHTNEFDPSVWDDAFQPLLTGDGKYKPLLPWLNAIAYHPQIRDLEGAQRHPEGLITGYKRTLLILREYLTMLFDIYGRHEQGPIEDQEDWLTRATGLLASTYPQVDEDAVTRLREKILQSRLWKIEAWYHGRNYSFDPACPFIPAQMKDFLAEVDKWGFSGNWYAHSWQWNAQFAPLLFGGQYDGVKKWLDRSICHNSNLSNLVYNIKEDDDVDEDPDLEPCTGFKRSKLLMKQYLLIVFDKNGCDEDGLPEDGQSEPQKERLRALLDIENPTVDDDAIQAMKDRLTFHGAWKLDPPDTSYVTPSGPWSFNSTFIPPLIASFFAEIGTFWGKDYGSNVWDTHFQPLLFGGRFDTIRPWMDAIVCKNEAIMNIQHTPPNPEWLCTVFERSFLLLHEYVIRIFERNDCDEDGTPLENQAEEQKGRLARLFDIENVVVDQEAVEEVKVYLLGTGAWKMED